MPDRRWPILLTLGLLLVPSAAMAQPNPAANPISNAISNTMPPHVAMPWALGVAIPQGQLLRYIWVQPQQVVIDSLVFVPVEAPAEAAAASSQPEAQVPDAAQAPDTARVPDTAQAPDSPRVPDVAQAPETPPAPPPTPQPAILRQTVVVPGYYVRETTAGFHIPERWVLAQSSPGVYAWLLAPAEFHRR